MTCTWEELGALSIARQFPDIEGRDAAAVAWAVGRVGPIQSQTARSPYVGLGGRLPGLTHATVTEAYESLGIVRGSNIRGTVHTSTPGQHALLDAATRVAQRGTWIRHLHLDDSQVESAWAAIEEHAADDWRTPDELRAHLRAWLATHADPTPLDRLDTGLGRYLGFGHGGLVRRPLKGPWSGQGAAGYRTATALLPDRPANDEPLVDLVRLHLASYGPSSRQDVAWWSGLGLRIVDDLLERLEPIWREGPDGRAYADLPDAPPPRELPGVRLLPEFDALLCGYDSKRRDRFVAPADNEVLWSRANGLMLAPVLVDGRIGGHWRVDGPGRTRGLSIWCFPGSRRPRKAEAREAADALGLALDVGIGDITVARA